jgi:hypothetical protein
MKNKRLMLLVFFACLLIAMNLNIFAAGTSYYVNSNAANASDAGPGSSAQPWKTLAPLNGRSFSPGDTIYFARGSGYTGGFGVSASGTSGSPITFTTYGSGNAPSFTNSNYSTLNGNVIQVQGKYITVDGLYFTGCANCPTTNDTDILKVGVVYGMVGSDYLTVQNCEFNDCPIGVYLNGQHSLVTNNYLHDCTRFLSNPDWGPIGIVVGNAYNEISYNRCNNYVHVGGNYGADGGFLEFDDRYFGVKVHDVKVHHNITSGNQGFLEVETQVTGSNLDVYYNVSNDYQEFIFYWGGSNSKIENNTVIRTLPSNNGAVNTVFTMKNSSFTARNNIFLVANGIQVWVTAPYGVGNYGSVVRQNNLYYCTDGSTSDPSGKPLGSGEKIANPSFVNLSGGDYHLNSNSPAINAGQSLGYTSDIDGNPVPYGAAPDIGAYEFQGTPAGTATPGPTATPTPTPVPGSWITVEDNASGWTYASGWAEYSDPPVSGGTAAGGNTIGGYGQYTFNGTGVQVYTWKGPDGGNVQIYIDGTSKGTFSETNASDIYNQMIYQITGLSSGNHTLKIVGQDANWTMIDYIKYTTGGGSATSTPTPTPTPTPVLTSTPTPTPGSGGSLAGSVVSGSTAVNLTTTGTADWAHWYGYDHKSSGGGKISNVSVIGGSATNYSNDLRAMSWTDGTPTASSSNNYNGSYIGGVNKGFQITAPADTAQKILKVYIGGWQSGGTFTAYLSDGSAADYTNTSLSGSGQYDGVYTITYKAASAGQTLTVTWKQASGTGNVTIQGAALQ